MIHLKRAYEPATPADGQRILVERLWPRGVSKERARIDLWAKDVAPSPELRRWYAHDVAKWEEFKARYFAELDARPAAVADLRRALRAGDTTFVFGSREERYNSATALREYLQRDPA